MRRSIEAMLPGTSLSLPRCPTPGSSIPEISTEEPAGTRGYSGTKEVVASSWKDIPSGSSWTLFPVNHTLTLLGLRRHSRIARRMASPVCTPSSDVFDARGWDDGRDDDGDVDNTGDITGGDDDDDDGDDDDNDGDGEDRCGDDGDGNGVLCRVNIPRFKDSHCHSSFRIIPHYDLSCHARADRIRSEHITNRQIAPHDLTSIIRINHQLQREF
eukprot:1454578-Rhodomonas_salina.1